MDIVVYGRTYILHVYGRPISIMGRPSMFMDIDVYGRYVYGRPAVRRTFMDIYLYGHMCLWTYTFMDVLVGHCVYGLS